MEGRCKSCRCIEGDGCQTACGLDEQPDAVTPPGQSPTSLSLSTWAKDVAPAASTLVKRSSAPAPSTPTSTSTALTEDEVGKWVLGCFKPDGLPE